MTSPKIWLIDYLPRQQHFDSLVNYLEYDWVFGDARQPAVDRAQPLDMAIVSDEFDPIINAAIHDCRRNRIPVLHIVDGIVEWHNTFENPRSLSPERGLPLFQPIVSDKIACLGRSQARILESWGNAGKCELVGSARLDRLRGREPRKRDPCEPFRVLIATAKKPGFTKERMNHVIRALGDFRDWMKEYGTKGPTKIEPIWRITGDLESGLGVDSMVSDLSGAELAEVLENVDALITTPSTMLLEGMMQGIPVALLDYSNSPRFVPAAWEITAADHIPGVMSELPDPPQTRKWYQDFILHDALECQSPAIERLATLVKTMVEIGKQARETQSTPRFPYRILPATKSGPTPPEGSFDLEKIYPDHSVFGQRDLRTLQTEVGQLRLTLERFEQRERRLGEELETTREALREEEREVERYRITHEHIMSKPLVKAYRKVKRLLRGRGDPDEMDGV